MGVRVHLRSARTIINIPVFLIVSPASMCNYWSCKTSKHKRTAHYLTKNEPPRFIFLRWVKY